MIHIGIPWLVILLVVLFLLSAFFSGSETAMMALNRYRIRHRARKGQKSAQNVLKMLERPDRLLGVILIGNTFANLLASAVVTVVAIQLFGDIGVLPATIILTILILIFAETTPKTLAALHPNRIAFRIIWPLRILLRCLYPLVWVVNGVANGILYLFRVRPHSRSHEALSAEELGTVVREASGELSTQYQQMLLSILNLEQIEVDDVMVPRNEIIGIDIDAPWEQVVLQIKTAKHAHIPVYEEHIDRVIGMLCVQDLVALLPAQSLAKDKLRSMLREIYFIPEGTLLAQQLYYFQKNNTEVGMVVDEYGDILGFLSMQDILEEIVGEFAGSMAPVVQKVKQQKDGSYLVDAGIGLRDLNRITGWNLPTDGPKTLSGLIIDELETIPTRPERLQLEGYHIEILSMEGTTIDRVRIKPAEEVGVKGSDSDLTDEVDDDADKA